MISFLKKRTIVTLYSNLLITLLCTTSSLFNGYYLLNGEVKTNNAKQLVSTETEPLSKAAVAGKVVTISNKGSSKKVTYVTQKGVKTSNRTYTKPSYHSLTGDAVVSFARQFVGLRYVYAGNSLKTGTDCSGFTKLVYKEFGVTLGRTVKAQMKNGSYIRKSDLQKGDLVFYGYNGKASHVAMYIGNGKVIHESTYKYGVKISPLNMMPYITSRRVINQKAIQTAENKAKSSNSGNTTSGSTPKVEEKNVVESNTVVENTTSTTNTTSVPETKVETNVTETTSSTVETNQ